MKNNKGYYSWIHSLNAASIDAHLKGKKMLAEQKQRKQNLMEEGLRPSGYEGASAMFAKERPADVLVRKQDVGQTSDEIYKKLRAEKEALGDLHKLSPEGIAAVNQLLSKNLQPTDVDVTGNGVADANDVRADAQNGIMGDQTEQLPEPIVHPPAQYKTPEAANAEVARLNASIGVDPKQRAIDANERKMMSDAAKQAIVSARQAGKGKKESREAGRKALRAFHASRQRDLTRQPPEKTIEVEGGMLPMEAVSHKIKKLLWEQSKEIMDQDPPVSLDRRSAQIGDESIGGMVFPPDIFKSMGRRANKYSEVEKLKHLIDIIANSEDHPPHHVTAAHEFFQNMSRFMKES